MTTRTSNTPGVIFDDGACPSVVGKETLEKSMRALNVDKVEVAKVALPNQRFGNCDDNQPSILAVKIRFWLTSSNSNESPIFNIAFQVIKGELPSLLRLPSLISMWAMVYHKCFTIAFRLRGKYRRFQQTHDGDHLCLAFRLRKPNDFSNKWNERTARIFLHPQLYGERKRTTA